MRNALADDGLPLSGTLRASPYVPAIVRSADEILGIVRKRDEIVRHSDDLREVVCGPDDLRSDIPTTMTAPARAFKAIAANSLFRKDQARHAPN